MLISLPPAPVIIRCVKGSRPQQTLNTMPLLVLPHAVGFIWKMRAVYKAPKQRRTPFCLCMDSWRMDQSLWRYHLTEWILGSSVDQKYLYVNCVCEHMGTNQALGVQVSESHGHTSCLMQSDNCGGQQGLLGQSSDPWCLCFFFFGHL